MANRAAPYAIHIEVDENRGHEDDRMRLAKIHSSLEGEVDVFRIHAIRVCLNVDRKKNNLAKRTVFFEAPLRGGTGAVARDTRIALLFKA